ncbi:MAG: beta-Ala-His dipeptidase [Acidobacteria bacterium]|nr:beta-Ala-His dipeptidase [Acidobacteriota bacterium]
MPSAVAELTPSSLWSRFDALTRVPRPSKKEERVRAWVLEWAAGHGFATREDSAGNIVVVVPATDGRDGAPVVVLQSHVDMVCEKNKGLAFDFDRDPIRTAVRDGWVVAEGTTLGADNGIGVAAAMAAATDPDVVHGPLELLFTVDEETGLTGAANLDPAIVHGRILLNLDTEEDGVLCVGCAGGADSHVVFPLRRESAPATVMRRVTVSGLRGGHSGMNIHENRGNAIRVLARVLEDADRNGLAFALVDFACDAKSNAIPREAEALVATGADDTAAWDAHLERWRSTLAVEFKGIDEDLQLELGNDTASEDPMTHESGQRLLNLILSLPLGVLGMHPTIPGLVEASNNVASVRCTKHDATIVASSRSSLAPALESIRTSIRASAQLVGAACEVTDSYPGWQPDPSSNVTEVLREVYATIWGKQPLVTAVHAGLECGLLGERIPGLDMISFGPTIRGAHSPRERVEIETVERFWRALVLALDRLSK